MESSDWPPFDLDLLEAEERALWDEYIAPHDETNREGPYVRVYSFGHICMLELGRIPKVVHEFMDDGRIAAAFTQYQTNMREARRQQLAAERATDEQPDPD